jgi:hypothetical protein
MKLLRRTLLHMAAGVIALPVVSRPIRALAAAVPYKFKAAIENPAFEWFFLLVDAGKEQGIWAKYGLDPEFAPTAGSAAQLKERVDAGIKLGVVNTAEVPLARLNGTPVKIIASYLAKQLQGYLLPRADQSKQGRIWTAKKLGS